MGSGSRQAWVFLTLGDQRIWGGNDGYLDDVAVSYEYDTFVPNHLNVDVGDVIFVRNGGSIVGVGLVESIEKWNGTHNLNRCPACNSTGIKPRVTKLPVYRCHSCGHQFDHPKEEVRDSTKYRAHYGKTFTRVHRPLFPKSIYVSKAAQNSIREVDMEAARNILSGWGVDLSAPVGSLQDEDVESPGPEQVTMASPGSEGVSGDPAAVATNPALSAPEDPNINLGARNEQPTTMCDSGVTTVDASIAREGAVSPDNSSLVERDSIHNESPNPGNMMVSDPTSVRRNWFVRLFSGLLDLISRYLSRR